MNHAATKKQEAAPTSFPSTATRHSEGNSNNETIIQWFGGRLDDERIGRSSQSLSTSSGACIGGAGTSEVDSSATAFTKYELSVLSQSDLNAKSGFLEMPVLVSAAKVDPS